MKSDFNGLYLYRHIILIHLICLLAEEHCIQSHVISHCLLHLYSCVSFMVLRPNIACISNCSHCAYGFVLKNTMNIMQKMLFCTGNSKKIHCV